MKRVITKTLAILLAITVIASAFVVPKPVNAVPLVKSVVSVTTCTASGILVDKFGNIITKSTDKLSRKLDEQISVGLKHLESLLPATIKKFLGIPGIPGVPGLPGIGLTVPVSDERTHIKLDSFRSDWVNKETRLDIIARCLARSILDTMVGNTMNVVRNHGRDGGPTFIQNWRNFTTGAQYRGENVFRAILSNAALCPHFSEQMKTLFKANTKTALPNQNTRVNNLDPYQLRANCTMPAGWSLDAYNQDFNANGGWLAFAKLLEPQNNALGSYNLALEEIGNQRNLEQTNDLTQAQSGGSFLGRSGRGATDSCLFMGENGRCIIYKDIKTPGSALGWAVSATTNQEIAWISNVDELNEVITAAMGRLLNRVLDLSSNDDTRVVDPEDLPNYRSVDIDYSDPDPLPPVIEEPIEEPDLSCAEQGLSDNYTGDVQTAISAVPSSISSLLNDDEGGPNNTAFINAVVNNLTSAGFTAGRLLHVATGKLNGDLVIVGHNPPDSDGEVYDILVGKIGVPFNSISGANCIVHRPWSQLVPVSGGVSNGGGTQPITSGTICTDGGDLSISNWPRAGVTCLTADYFPPGTPGPAGFCPSGNCVIVNQQIRDPDPFTAGTPWPVSLRRNEEEIYSIPKSQPDSTRIDTNVTPGARLYDLIDSNGNRICGSINCARVNITIP